MCGRVYYIYSCAGCVCVRTRCVGIHMGTHIYLYSIQDSYIYFTGRVPGAHCAVCWYNRGLWEIDIIINIIKCIRRLKAVSQ